MLYTLRCANGHTYDAWFRSSADYEEKKATGTLACAQCGTHDIGKGIMAPAVGGSRDSDPAPAPSCGMGGGCGAGMCGLN